MNNKLPDKSHGVVQGVLSVMLCLAILAISQTSQATSATEILKTSEKAVEVGVKAQFDYESWVEQEHRLLEEIEDLENLLDHLHWQRKKLAAYQGDLKKKIEELNKKAEAMEAVNMKLLPVLEKNLARLQAVVEDDIPSNMTERRKSLHHTTMVLSDYDMGLLDMTRAVLDATAREVDLGHHVNVLEDSIDVDGASRRVKMLQVGRVGLYAMTLDSKKAYRWDVAKSIWQPIEDATTSIHDAIEMAEGIRLVGLSKLPVEQPEKRQERGVE